MILMVAKTKLEIKALVHGVVSIEFGQKLSRVSSCGCLLNWADDDTCQFDKT